MVRATILFDFDSTIIKGESFELMLTEKLTQSPEVLAQITQLTKMGMAGEIPFADSVKRRFGLVSPSLKDIDCFIDVALPGIITKGFQTLFKKLFALNIDIWIVSGGLKKLILPFASYLAIEPEKVIALDGIWDEQGNFIEVIKNTSLISKIEATKPYQNKWQTPVIIVGDGYTDYQLKQSKIANYFICYTEHVQRDEVIALADIAVSSASELEREILNKLAD
ncbi:HAD-IB family phosphatase [Thiotrichales bacterium 19S3-7]|nr:HAD-IB family phosphatase [Thiotrichales bacterium 19S3-7]MCF6801158.1 HAD-IB family phosphatase [Thiotrichales bacterium 19S3-11]